MGARIDYTGVKYNRLTGIAPTEKRKSGAIVWKWQCDCGNEVLCDGNSVKTGHTKSCGCLNKELTKQRAAEMGVARRIDYTGKTYNKLTGIKYLSTTSGGNAIWLWQCECGNIHEADANNVKRGHITSCGCYTKSIPEQTIEALLKEHNVNFKAQYNFAGELIGEKKKCLSFDYAVLDLNDNLLYLIEYDGRQHFQSVEYWGGQEALLKRQQYDMMKNRWCQEHNIALIRIPYTHKNIIIEDLILEKSKFIYTLEKEKDYYKRKDAEE